MKFTLFLSGAFLSVAAAVHAAPVTYNINFTGVGTLPTSGSFTYDAANPVFTNFIVVWQGISFNLTAGANVAFAAGACNTPGTPAEDAFSFLSNPVCGSGAFQSGWQAFPVLATYVFSFNRFDLQFGATDWVSVETGTSGPAGLQGANGAFSIAAVPEPATLPMVLAGGAWLAWRRRRPGNDCRSHPLPPQRLSQR